MGAAVLNGVAAGPAEVRTPPLAFKTIPDKPMQGLAAYYYRGCPIPT